jgi:predicted dehydrogenase
MTMNRRTSLRFIAMGGIAPMVLPARLLGQSGPNQRINLAAIGCGRMGRGNIGNLIASGKKLNSAFVAVCDVDKNRLRDAAELVRSRSGSKEPVAEYTDYRELLERKDIDAVLISTPDHSHGMVALAAIRAGKDAYVEKPLTYGVREGRELVQAVREHGRILQVGSMQRSSVHFRRVCELARSGRLGKIETIEVGLPMDKGQGDPAPMEVPPGLDFEMWLKPGKSYPYTEHRVHPQESYRRPGFMQVSSHCRGMITGWGSHMVDNALWGIGFDDTKPFRVTCTADFPDRGLFDVHTRLHAEIALPDGIVIKIKCDAEAKAGVRFNGSEAWAHAWRGKFEASDRELLREPKGVETFLAVSNDHHVNWLESIRSRKDPVAPVEGGQLTNNFCVAALAAGKAAGGRELTWDPAKEEFHGNPEANAILNF